MTSFKKTNTLSAMHCNAATDSVLNDSIALASHMRNCISTRSRFFNLHAAMDFGHVLLCTRIVTCAVVAVAAIGMLALVGIV